MIPEYELTVGPGDTVILTCANCGAEFEQLRWQFEVDVEEEGEDYEPACPDCLGLFDDIYPLESEGT